MDQRPYTYLTPLPLKPNTPTKQGPCENAHKDELKQQFDAAVDKGERGALADQGDYERALEGTLREFIQEADRKIQRGIRVGMCVCAYDGWTCGCGCVDGGEGGWVGGRRYRRLIHTKHQHQTHHRQQ